MDEETRLANYQAKREASLNAKNEASEAENIESKQNLGSRMSNFEWWLLIGALASIDLGQIILDFFAIGLAANRVIDLVVAMAMPLYLTLRGYKMDMKTVLLIGVSLIAEEIPLLDAAPFWTFDGWRLYKLDKERKSS